MDSDFDVPHAARCVRQHGNGNLLVHYLEETVNILFCGLSTFPNRMDASSNRYRSIAEISTRAGASITFINHGAVAKSPKLAPDERDFPFLSPSGFRSDVFILRQVKKILTWPRVYYAIRAENKKSKIAYIHVYTEYFATLLCYRVIASTIGAIPVLHLTEMRSAFVERSLLRRVNHYLFESVGVTLYSHFITISKRTDDLAKNRSGAAKVLRIPPICNFSALDLISKEEEVDEYILYCASMAYEEVAWFVIQAYLLLGDTPLNLRLILNGKLSPRISEAVETTGGRIQVFSNLSYNRLVSMYKSARALLIPLRNSTQDEARFPQKISEYMAATRPIITTAVGEIPHYFTDGKNAFVCDTYDIVKYSEKMKEAIRDDERSSEIAKESRRLGEQCFDLNAYVSTMQRFLRLPQINLSTNPE